MNNKNILFLTHTYANFQKDSIEAIAPHFNQVTVLVRYKPISEISNYLPINYLKPHRKSYSIDLTNVPSNVRVIPVPVNYLPTKKSYFNLGEALYTKVKNIILENDIQFDLIHAHYIWTSGYVGSRLKQDFNKPLFITNHSTHQLTKYLDRGLSWKNEIKNVLGFSNHTFVVNRFMKNRVQKISPQTSVSVIPVGYRNDLFYKKDKNQCRLKLDMPLDKRYFINIGSLEKVKNQELLLRAFKKFVINQIDARLIIIGQGSLENYLKNLIEELHLEKHVTLITGIPHNEVVDWINASDFFVLTSKSEGSPTVMYESLACGVPFIGSRVGGIPEIINSEKYGLLFESEDELGLVEVLKKSLKTYWNEFEILKYAKNFEQGEIVKKILEVYYLNT